MNNEDTIADIKMRFRQIISIVDLVMESNNDIDPNLLTIRDLAQIGFDKIINCN